MLLPSVRKFVLLAIATMCGVFNFSYRPVPAIVQDRTVQRFAGSEEQGGSQDLRKVLSSFYTRRSDYEWGEFRGYVFLFCLSMFCMRAPKCHYADVSGVNLRWLSCIWDSGNVSSVLGAGAVSDMLRAGKRRVTDGVNGKGRANISQQVTHCNCGASRSWRPSCR